jgi:hypothetical protein
MDPLHCQRETARYIVADKHADYSFTAVKDNQPGLFDTLGHRAPASPDPQAVPWAR